MRRAPSVQYPVGRSFWYGAFLMGSGLLAAGLWVLAALVYGLSWAVAAVGILLCWGWALWAGRMAWRTPPGWLIWYASAPARVQADLPPYPGAWLWRSAAYQDGLDLREVRLVWDGQDWMLLALSHAAGVRWWVWVERRADAPRWQDLRRAVVG